MVARGPLLPRTITGPVTRLGAAAQNALEVARFGGLATDEQPSPFDVVSEQRVYRLRHCYAQTAPSGPPVVLVPPLMLAAEVYDDAPSTSAVTILREHGAPTSARPRVGGRARAHARRPRARGLARG